MAYLVMLYSRVMVHMRKIMIDIKKGEKRKGNV